MPFLKTKKGIICIVLAAVLVVCGIGAALGFWYYSVPKFQNVTVELGTQSVSLSQFMTKFAISSQVGFPNGTPNIDVGKVGTQELTLSHLGKVETVTLTVADTTAPQATFTEKRTEFINYVPKVEDFVTDIQDLSETKVYFAKEPKLSEDYSDITVKVVVEDASGNQTIGESVVSFVWLRDKFSLELGDTLKKEDILFDVEQDGELISQEEIDKINQSGLGEYTLESLSEEKAASCVVTVQDTKGPELKLRDVTIYEDQRTALRNFIKSAEDISGGVKTRLVTELKFGTAGKQTVTVEAEDKFGNKSTAEATLKIIKNNIAPTISGLKAMSVKRNSNPDFMKGVTAKDDRDGACKVTVNTDKVNLNKAGTYYAVYTAKDKAGNVRTAKRKIVVEHNSDDTKELVKKLAAKLGNDPVELSMYVRNTIKYNHNWGGDDPVWYGLKNKKGNCYVHALVLRALFREKGIACKLIWVKDKSHYWLLVRVGGQWKHIDPTPGTKHPAYLMNDEQRYKNLQGRDWDRSKWPECN